MARHELVRTIAGVLGLCLAAFPLQGCRLPAGTPAAVQPLDREGEIEIYLEALPPGAERLHVTLSSISARPAGPPSQLGHEEPLVLRTPEISGETEPRLDAHLLAWGRLPPGDYRGLMVGVQRATLEREEQRSDLLVDAKPVEIEIPFAVEQRQTTLLRLSLDYSASVTASFGFAPRFQRQLKSPIMPGAVGVVSNAAEHNLTVFDKQSKKVVSVIPTGRTPTGLALDALNRRVYVALAQQDAIEVVDLAAQQVMRRIPLRPGDEPGELALARDILVSVNSGSNSVSFIDPRTALETSRVSVGQDPRSVVVDAARRRVYVLDFASDDIAVVDPANRAVVRTVATESRPLRAELSRDGTQLYLVHAGSPFMLVFTLPELTVAQRVFVGLGMRSIKVDPSTGRILIGMNDDELLVFEPAAFLPVETLHVPGAISLMSIDPSENTLAMLVPTRGLVAFMRLADHRMLGALEVGGDPRFLVVP